MKLRFYSGLPCGLLWPLALSAVAIASGCAAPQQPFVPPPLFKAPDLAADARGTPLEIQAQSERRTVVTTVPAVPAASRTSTVKPETTPPSAAERADLMLAFDQMPLPSFIQIVFSQILKKNISVDPTLLGRTDLVTLRTGQPQTPAQVQETVRLLLKSYGVAVQEISGLVRVVPDTNQSGYLPEIRRGRAQPDVPLPMRPVFHFVELTAVRQAEVSQWLKAMFGTRLTIQDDPGRNALLISGQSAEVTAALEAIQVLDQPLMRSRGSRLITPASLGADDMARRLIEILSAEGYAVALGAAPGLPISLVPVPASNALLVFAQDQAVLDHVVEWAVKLDQLDTSNRRSGGNYFSYEVKYADAQLLAKTLQELMGGPVASSAPSNAQIVIGAPRQPARVVVNATTNTLIVSTQNSEDYGQLLSLMRTLDRPSKSAMIEVTVAEVTAGTSSQLGIDWSLAPQSVSGGTIVGGTLGGVNLGTGGLSLSYLNTLGAIRARLNALASQNKARILSTPRVMARNGETATIQVGQEVPIITSQQSTTATTTSAPGISGGAGVLQTIQYRSTGVILKVKPVIFAGRVELDVQQEVSSAASTTTGVNVSPTFSTRKIDTKVSIRDGATVALGGLISRNDSGGDSGVPGLKDIPGAGQLFRNNTSRADETELIILITPYVVENDLVAEQVTQALRGQMGAWAQPSPDVGTRPEKLTTLPVSDVLAPVSVAPGEDHVTAPAAITPPQPGVAGAVLPAGPVKALPLPLVPGTLPPGGVPVTDPALLEELRGLQKGAPAVRAPGPAVAPAGSVPASGATTVRPTVKTPPVK
ncbi:MAG: hypothetical protein H7274_13590 [Rhodoferax sp.]|nr:hypothetical protein [Rhodoferax sp.]